MGWRTLLTGRWSVPVFAGAALGGALVAGSLVREAAYDTPRWPRRMTIIEHPVPPSEQMAFLERLCTEGRERGYRCDVGTGRGNLQPVHFVELWEGDVHITALAVDPMPVIRIQLFADVADRKAGEVEWLRTL